MSFLTAEWRKLALANYEVDPIILKPFVPAKTELDIWEGTCYVSLVGFMFVNTRLLGLPIPGHRHFEEVNLRFYVRYKDRDVWKRGVVFIKEIVPKPALTWVANTVYKEHYQTMKMFHMWEETGDFLNVKYSWVFGGKSHFISVKTDALPVSIPTGSETEFITEHYWGYTKISHSKTLEYEVTHPKWQSYKVRDYNVQVDFGMIYGNSFSELSDITPKSVMLAEGSGITVENKRQIT